MRYLTEEQKLENLKALVSEKVIFGYPMVSKKHLTLLDNGNWFYYKNHLNVSIQLVTKTKIVKTKKTVCGKETIIKESVLFADRLLLKSFQNGEQIYENELSLNSDLVTKFDSRKKSLEFYETLNLILDASDSYFIQCKKANDLKQEIQSKKIKEILSKIEANLKNNKTDFTVIVCDTKVELKVGNI